MGTNTRPPRPIRQFYIGLEADVADALTAAAVREDRPGKMQAARYVVAGLRRAGYLPPEPDIPGSSESAEPEPDAEPAPWRAVKP